MAEPIRAPWRPTQVHALNAFQRSSRMHPFTCGGAHDGPSPVLVAARDGWHCPDEACPYIQDWAHPFMAAVPAEFDGCNYRCRQPQEHTLEWGECALAPESARPEPRLSVLRVRLAADGDNEIVTDSLTLVQLADVIEPALRSVHVRLGPNALAILRGGGTVGLSGGEYRDLALAAAQALIDDKEIR